MSAKAKTQAPERLGIMRLGLFAGALLWLLVQTGPVFRDGVMQPLPALIGFVAAVTCLRLVIECLYLVAGLMDWFLSRTPSGSKGMATWGNTKDLKRELNRKKNGPFWGRTVDGKKTPLFIDYASNAMTVAPAGSGKGIYTVIPNIFSIRCSKVIADFKGELICVMKAALLKFCGETVRILNPGNLWLKLVGMADSYNPLDIIVDNPYRPGGLRDVPDDLREIASQIYPEPEGGKSDNTYWHEGSRDCIDFGILLETMIEGYDATLSSVALLLEDRTTLEHNLRWILGINLKGEPLPDGPMPIEQTEWAQHHSQEDVAAFAKWVRARASNLLTLMTSGEGRTFDSFISGAQQALAPFAYGRLASAMQRSTFSMNDLKSGKKPTSLFIVADASRMEAYKPYIGLMQWCAMTAIKRHPEKARPVHFIMDEATNYKIHGLDNLLTWGRSYGLRLHLIFQDLSAFANTYGEKALETLLSETEIKQFLPGQRSPKTLKLITQLLGEQSVMLPSFSQPELTSGVNASLREEARPLAKTEEVRRSELGLLIVRQAKPVLFEPISYAEIHPWRKQAGINPFHGKPFLKKVKIRL